MTHLDCAAAREIIPDLASRPLGPGTDSMDAAVAGHLASCAECRAELDLVRAIRASRAAPPEELAERVIAAARRDRVGHGRPWWALTAAAVAALALGIGIASESSQEVTVPGYAHEIEQGDVWSSDDGIVAGAPTLEGLSEEALRQLLDELSVGSSGGAV